MYTLRVLSSDVYEGFDINNENKNNPEIKIEITTENSHENNNLDDITNIILNNESYSAYMPIVFSKLVHCSLLESENEKLNQPIKAILEKIDAHNVHMIKPFYQSLLDKIVHKENNNYDLVRFLNIFMALNSKVKSLGMIPEQVSHLQTDIFKHSQDAPEAANIELTEQGARYKVIHR